MTPAERIAALKAELAETKQAGAAMRAFILELLTAMTAEFTTTPEGRRQVAIAYLAKAEQAHPAVADVLTKAAVMVDTRGEC